MMFAILTPLSSNPLPVCTAVRSRSSNLWAFESMVASVVYNIRPLFYTMPSYQSETLVRNVRKREHGRYSAGFA
jgi:hypothetical protein